MEMLYILWKALYIGKAGWSGYPLSVLFYIFCYINPLFVMNLISFKLRALVLVSDFMSM